MTRGVLRLFVLQGLWATGCWLALSFFPNALKKTDMTHVQLVLTGP